MLLLLNRVDLFVIFCRVGEGFFVGCVGFLWLFCVCVWGGGVVLLFFGGSVCSCWCFVCLFALFALLVFIFFCSFALLCLLLLFCCLAWFFIIIIIILLLLLLLLLLFILFRFVLFCFVLLMVFVGACLPANYK